MQFTISKKSMVKYPYNTFIMNIHAYLNYFGDKKMNLLMYRYNSICEPDLIDTFQAIGFTVIEEKYEMTNKKVFSFPLLFL